MKKLSTFALFLPLTLATACGDDSEDGTSSTSDASSTESTTGTTGTTTESSTTATSTATASTTESGSTTGTTGTTGTTTETGTTGTTTETGTTTDTDTTTGGNLPAECTAADVTCMDVAGVTVACNAVKADTTWSGTVLLQDLIYVCPGATLTIEAGTTVLGQSGTALVSLAGAQIEAIGTAAAPIVMTSINDRAGSTTTPQRQDWGGLVLIGDAPVNLDGGAGNAEGFEVPIPYGGTNAASDCGTLQYVRVEWAGNELSPGNELNGITWYACGTGTTVDHIQSHMGSDDGLEAFGGSFDMSYLVVTGASDDSIDLDQGYTGDIQFVFVHQDPVTANHGFEWSNQGTNFEAEPTTSVRIANATLVGSGAGADADMTSSRGSNFKEGVRASVWNTIFTNFNGQAILMTEQETTDEFTAGNIVVQFNIFTGNALKAGADEIDVRVNDGMADGGAANAAAEMAFETYLNDVANANQFGADPGLPSAAWTAPDVTPAAGGPTAMGAGMALPDEFVQAGYIGAVEPGAATPWTEESWIDYTVTAP